MDTQLYRTTPPPISDFHSLSLPEFEVATLANGIKIHYFNAGDDQVTRMAVIWDAGTLDVENPSALAMLAAMLPEGNEALSGKEVSDRLEGNGAWLKIYELPHSVAAILHSLNHTASVVFPLLADVLTRPSFPKEALDSLKQKAAADKRLAMERPSFQAAVASRKELYGDTPLGRIITPESIMGVEQEDLKRLHRNLLLSAMPEIYIAGAVTPELLNQIQTNFGNLKFDIYNPEAIKFKSVEIPPQNGRRMVTVEMASSLQTAIKYHIPTIDKNHPDFETLRVAVMILGGYFGSRLMSNLREEHGYTYGVNAMVSMQADAASISITTDCDNRYAAACLAEIDKEIERMATENVSEEELNTARQIIISSLSSILDSPITIEACREMLAINHQDESVIAKNFEAAKTVTPDDIRRVSTLYLLNAPGVIAIAGSNLPND